MSRKPISPELIDAILPQTQCGLCGYGGCMPYAEALSKDDAAINLCPPGGVKVLNKIADLLNEDAKPFIAEMEKKAKPKMLAIIREDECIGCTKCLQACPVDAILGASKQMHTIISQECTGCELCIAPCPVDCIDIVEIFADPEDEEEKANVARVRFREREIRLAQEKAKAVRLHPTVSLTNQTLDNKKAFIQEALLRSKKKK